MFIGPRYKIQTRRELHGVHHKSGSDVNGQTEIDPVSVNQASTPNRKAVVKSVHPHEPALDFHLLAEESPDRLLAPLDSIMLIVL